MVVGGEVGGVVGRVVGGGGGGGAGAIVAGVCVGAVEFDPVLEWVCDVGVGATVGCVVAGAGAVVEVGATAPAPAAAVVAGIPLFKTANHSFSKFCPLA